MKNKYFLIQNIKKTTFISSNFFQDNYFIFILTSMTF